MRFTLWTVAAPAAVALLAASLDMGVSHSRAWSAIGGLAGLALVFSIPLNVIYWLVRLIRYAWRG